MSDFESGARRPASTRVYASSGMWVASVCLFARECAPGRAWPRPDRVSTRENPDAGSSSSFLPLAPVPGASSQNPRHLSARGPPH